MRSSYIFIHCMLLCWVHVVVIVVVVVVVVVVIIVVVRVQAKTNAQKINPALGVITSQAQLDQFFGGVSRGGAAVLCLLPHPSMHTSNR